MNCPCPHCGAPLLRPKRKIGLTRMQKNLLDALQSGLAANGIVPSYAELRVKLGLKSKSGVARLMKQLEERGHIERTPARARAVSIL